MKRRSVFSVLLMIMMMTVVAFAEDPAPLKLDIETGNVSDGYITIKKPATEAKLMVSVSRDDRSVMYPLCNESDVLPLQLGDGDYTITLYEVAQSESGAEDSEYIQLDQLVIPVDTDNMLSCYLHPNLYVDYSDDSPWILKANELIAQDMSESEIFLYITDYMVKNYEYDFIKSVTVDGAGTMIPDITYCWENRRGISQDLSALTCAMLRSQGIPAILVMGRIGSGTPYSWVIAYVDSNIVFFDPTARLQASNTADLFYDICKSDLKVDATY